VDVNAKQVKGAAEALDHEIVDYAGSASNRCPSYFPSQKCSF